MAGDLLCCSSEKKTGDLKFPKKKQQKFKLKLHARRTFFYFQNTFRNCPKIDIFELIKSVISVSSEDVILQYTYNAQYVQYTLYKY